MDKKQDSAEIDVQDLAKMLALSFENALGRKLKDAIKDHSPPFGAMLDHLVRAAVAGASAEMVRLLYCEEAQKVFREAVNKELGIARLRERPGSP